MDFLAVLALGDWDAAARFVRENPKVIQPASGVLHLMTKRNDLAAVKWLLGHGADPNGRWAHWDADVPHVRLAAMGGNVDVAHVLVQAGADPHIHDSKHDSDTIGWAEFFGHQEVARILHQAS